MNGSNSKNLMFIVLFILILSFTFICVVVSGEFDSSIYMDLP